MMAPAELELYSLLNVIRSGPTSEGTHMFEQAIEMEKKEGSWFAPVLIILVLVGLFVGGFCVVIFQSKLTLKPSEAAAAVDTKLKSSAPVTVSFHTGLVSYAAADKPSDPQYKLFENAGILKITKGKGYAAQVDLTPEGKQLLASLADVQMVQDTGNTTEYILPLATRKLVSVNKVLKLTPDRFQVEYTWAWQTTKAGDMFDIPGKLVQELPPYERSVLIDQHGASYFHGEPAQDSLLLMKSDKGWAPVFAN